MTTSLVVGDVHAVPEELQDCEALLGLIQETAFRAQVDRVVFMGDQHNAHDTMSTRVLAFWKAAFRSLESYERVALVGNHDMVSPTARFPHAMLAYDNIYVVDRPCLAFPGVCGMPYFHDPKEFLVAATALKAAHPDVETLFCHQTFVGADGGFYAKDECNAAAVPFRSVISGHIHTPQVVDRKVLYVGAPRWRSKDDAGKQRFLYVMQHAGRTKVVEKVPTDTVCRRIYVFQDRPDAPAPLATVPEAQRGRAQVRVDVFGPAAYVKERELVLRAAGCRTRGVPDRARRAVVTEAEGVDVAFGRFLEAFVPPGGTNKARLRALLEERMTR